MELTAVIRALEALKRGCAVSIHTDSQYVKNGIETWIHNWKRNGWKTADRKPVKNAELWRELDALAAQHDIEWHWVKGHNGHPGNERADALANRGVEIDRIDERAADGLASLPGDPNACARYFLEPPREHPHLLFGLLVAPPGGDLHARPIGGKRFVVAAGRGERLAVELPRGGEVRVLRDGAREMFRGARRVAGLEVLVAERKAQQRPVLARREQLLERLQRGRRRHRAQREMNSPDSQLIRRIG